MFIISRLAEMAIDKTGEFTEVRVTTIENGLTRLDIAESFNIPEEYVQEV